MRAFHPVTWLRLRLLLNLSLGRDCRTQWGGGSKKHFKLPWPVPLIAAGLPDDDLDVLACSQMMIRIQQALDELLEACPAESVTPSQLPRAIERLQLALREAIQASLRQDCIDDAQDALQALEAQLRAQQTGEARAWLQDATKSRGKQGQGSNGIRLQMWEAQVLQPRFVVSVVGCSLKT